MTSPNESTFKRNYQKHRQHLKLKGLPPKTIDAYSRAIRRIGVYFNHDILSSLCYPNDLDVPEILVFYTRTANA